MAISMAVSHTVRHDCTFQLYKVHSKVHGLAIVAADRVDKENVVEGESVALKRWRSMELRLLKKSR